MAALERHSLPRGAEEHFSLSFGWQEIVVADAHCCSSSVVVLIACMALLFANVILCVCALVLVVSILVMERPGVCSLCFYPPHASFRVNKIHPLLEKRRQAGHPLAARKRLFMLGGARVVICCELQRCPNVQGGFYGIGSEQASCRLASCNAWGWMWLVKDLVLSWFRANAG